MRTAFGGAIAVALLAGCPDDAAPARDWRFEFEDPGAAAGVRVVAGAIHAGTCGDVPGAPVYETELRRGEVGAAPPHLARGSYAFRGRGRNEECETVTTGCTDVMVPGSGEIVVVLRTTVTEVDCITALCDEGACRPPDAGAPDAGADDAGAIDGGADAGRPDGGPPDGGLDAGPCGACGADERCDGTACVAADAVRAVAAGYAHTCAIRFDGVMFCWGANGRGQLGDGTVVARPRPTAVTAPAATRWQQVAASDHTCAIDQADQLWCWGRNDSGQSGTGDVVDHAEPTPVVVDLDGDGTAEIGGWTAVGLSRYATCALAMDGDVWCWGADGEAIVGDGDPSGGMHDQPVRLTLTQPARELIVGDTHACAILEDDSMWCWGGNARGETGIGMTTTDPVLAPTPVAGTRSWRTAAGGFQHTCAIATDGRLWCWGRNLVGQLGRGFTSDSEPAMAETNDTRATWTGVAAGWYHNCALAPSGGGTGMWCWGRNDLGEAGVGDRVNRREPAQVTGTDWSAVAGGEEHTCALRAGGTLVCMGSNASGQLGLAGAPADAIVPTVVSIPPAP